MLIFANVCMWSQLAAYMLHNLDVFGSLCLPMFAFGAKLLHIYSMFWCLFDACPMLMFANVCIWSQTAYMQQNPFLVLIRCLFGAFLPMFVFGANWLHICSTILMFFGSFSLPMFAFGAKLLHIYSMFWCLFDACSMLMFANVCIWLLHIYAATSLFGVCSMTIRCLCSCSARRPRMSAVRAGCMDATDGG